jgi:hypothetical protein
VIDQRRREHPCKAADVGQPVGNGGAARGLQRDDDPAGRGEVQVGALERRDFSRNLLGALRTDDLLPLRSLA